jgi:hypothetical protein
MIFEIYTSMMIVDQDFVLASLRNQRTIDL